MVRMFSLNDLAKGCVQIENSKATPYNERGSGPIICRSELHAAEEENADTSYNITDLQTVSIPEELVSPVYAPGETSAHSGVLSIQIIKQRSSSSRG